MEEFSSLISALIQGGWLAIVLVLLFKYHKSLSGLIARISKFNLKLPDGTELAITAQEAAGLAQELLAEIDDSLVKDITAEEQAVLKKVVNQSDAPTVKEIFPQFCRPSPELETLRSMRRRQLIRPRGGGTWKPNKRIDIKPMGAILLKIRGDKLLGEPTD